jgi:hypothetical protein
MKRLSLALLLTLSGCTLAGTSSRREGAYEHYTVRKCDWKSQGQWLWRGASPNSPLLPFHRGDTRTTSQKLMLDVVFVGFPIFMDLFMSPFTYATGRECWTTDSGTRYVGTPEDNSRRAKEERAAKADADRRAAEARAASDKAAAAAREAADKAAAERKAAEERLARDYPVLPSSLRPGPQRPRDFALIVGVESYRAQLPKADYGEDDARGVKDYLTALGVPERNIILLTGQGASRSDMTKYLDEWLPGNVSADSRVYFYFSGHGAPDASSGAAYLIPWDGDPAFVKSTGYSVSDLYAKLEALPAKESVVMLDACFTGSGGRSVLAPGSRPLVAAQEEVPRPGKVRVLAAAGSKEIAGSLDLRRHGLFTYFLLRGLGGDADADKNGSLTLSELHGFVREGVSGSARRANRDQTPRLLGDGALPLY